MKKKRNNFGYYMSESVNSIFTHRFMSFASVAIIVACLLIMGSFTLLAININALIKEVENENEIVAYVDETLSDEEARAIESRLLTLENVSGVTFVPREEAMEAFFSNYEDRAAEGIDAFVFRHRYVVYMDEVALMSQTELQLREVEGIAKVNANVEVANIFVTIRNVVSAVSITLVVILLCISIFIIANTIKITTFDRREEIAIMKMVGATNGFIQWPFILQGFILGVAGAIVAFFLQWGLYELVAEGIMGSIAGNLISVVRFFSVSNLIGSIFVLTGFLVGVLGSVITIRKYLRV